MGEDMVENRMQWISRQLVKAVVLCILCNHFLSYALWKLIILLAAEAGEVVQVIWVEIKEVIFQLIVH